MPACRQLTAGDGKKPGTSKNVPGQVVWAFVNQGEGRNEHRRGIYVIFPTALRTLPHISCAGLSGWRRRRDPAPGGLAAVLRSRSGSARSTGHRHRVLRHRPDSLVDHRSWSPQHASACALASFASMSRKRLSLDSTDDGHFIGIPQRDQAPRTISVREPGRPGRPLPYLRPFCHGHPWPPYHRYCRSILWIQ